MAVEVATGELGADLLGPLELDPGQHPLEEELLGPVGHGAAGQGRVDQAGGRGPAAAEMTAVGPRSAER